MANVFGIGVWVCGDPVAATIAPWCRRGQPWARWIVNSDDSGWRRVVLIVMICGILVVNSYVYSVAIIGLLDFTSQSYKAYWTIIIHNDEGVSCRFVGPRGLQVGDRIYLERVYIRELRIGFYVSHQCSKLDLCGCPKPTEAKKKYNWNRRPWVTSKFIKSLQASKVAKCVFTT